jgi:hypothetical protein
VRPGHIKVNLGASKTTMGLKDIAKTPHSRSAEVPNREVYSVDDCRSAVDIYASGRGFVKGNNCG